MRDSARSAAIAVLAIIAVAVVAATIESTVDPERGGSGGSSGGGAPGGGGILPAGNATAPGETLQIPFLTEITVVLGVLVVITFLAYLYVYRRAALKVFVSLAVVIGVLYVVFSVLGFPPDSSLEPPPRFGNGSPFGGGDGGGADSGAAEQPSLPSILLILGLIAALLGTIIAYLRTASDDDDRTQTEETEGVDPAAVGEAAGRAADRLEQDESADNEVYRAWREMTALLDIPDPETSTPGDFETAAVEAGMGREDVRELTRLFEDVRYGTVDPSPDRERRAIDVFRRIETRYTEDGQ